MSTATVNAELMTKSQAELSSIVEGIAKDTAKMEALFVDAANRTHLNAMSSLGEYFNGLGQQLDAIQESMSSMTTILQHYIEDTAEIDHDDLHIGE